MKKQRYKKTCTLKVSSTVQGAIGETKVISLLLENGYEVSKPICDRGIDLIIGKSTQKNRIENYKSVQVKFHTRISNTSYGKALRIKITPNQSHYIAIPIERGIYDDKEHIIFYPQDKDMIGKEYFREFAIYIDEVAKENGKYRNHHKRRWAKDFFKLPKGDS